MEKWKHLPSVFRRNISLTALTGLGCGAVSVVVFCVSKDQISLILGCILLLMCTYKVFSFWNCAAGAHYHVLSGLCHIPKSYSPLRLRKVILTDSNGVETTLLLDRKAGVKDGLYYRLYFQGTLPEETGSTKLDAALRSDALIGVEQIEPEEISKEISE